MATKSKKVITTPRAEVADQPKRPAKTLAWVDDVPASTKKNSPLAQLAEQVRENEGKVAAIEYASQRSASAAARALRRNHGLNATTRANVLYVSTGEEAKSRGPSGSKSEE